MTSRGSDARKWGCIWHFAEANNINFYNVLNACATGHIYQGEIHREDNKTPITAAVDYIAEYLNSSRDEIAKHIRNIKDSSNHIVIPQNLALSLPVSEVDLSTPTVAATHAPNTSAETTSEPDNVLAMPMQQRASYLIDKLITSGFKVDECLAGQIIALCGSQRGGKGTLAGILAILSQAVEPGSEVHYFSAGTDIYPYKCSKLVCGFTHPNVENPDAKVAQAMLAYLKELDNKPQYSCKKLVIVLDELMTLTDLLDEEDKKWLVRFLLVRAAKKGATIIMVLHASTITAWVGAAAASGMSSTFKSLTFVGCDSKSVKSGALKRVSIATGKYFLASPENFGIPKPDGDLGEIPDWLKQVNNPDNGYPDPVRTLLKFFPELTGDPRTMAAPKDKSQTFLALPKEDTVTNEVDEDKELSMDFNAAALGVSIDAYKVLEKMISIGEPADVRAIQHKRPFGRKETSADKIRDSLKELVAARLVLEEQEGDKVYYRVVTT
ncbi:MAG: ATP-binding protein [Rivularia sp. T60_A2020_040]|nr:ATP-binding protein [Rivularia sp. T60_A2020_040]